MTYYQELGIDPAASAEEIRRAYRHQIKVFHPDLQTDDRMRATAEAKVRRLNEIVQVLADPEQRRVYDYELLLQHRNRPQEDLRPVGAQQKQVRMAIAGVAAMAAAGLFWISRPADLPPAAEESPRLESKLQRVPAALERRIAAAAAERAGRRQADSRPDRKVTVREEKADSKPLPAHSAATPAVKPADIAAPPAPAPVPAAAPAPATTAAESSAAPGPLAANPLEGTWLFQPARTEAAEKKLYPPKYIELRIQADAGTLFGRYRSSYEVHDQPLSPNVNFNFQGPAAGSQARATWLGPGGARGSVELRLLNPMNLQVDWKAEQTAPGLDLVSGTAVLVKRIEN